MGYLNSKIVFLAKNIYTYCIIYVLGLFIGSIVSPQMINSDPGFGFLDMFNLKNGGKFLFHSHPYLSNLDLCTETMTTWWSPGQWLVPYLVTLTGFNLGLSISISVLLFSVFGIIGWRQLFNKIGFENRVIEISVLLILVSRYFYTPFQIYNGGALFEFAISPWMIYTWLTFEEESTFKKALLLVILILVSYIFKTSLLLLVLILCLQDSLEIKNRQIDFKKILYYAILFLTTKYLLDDIFISGGPTPFNSLGILITKNELFRLLTIQRLLFIFSGPFLATIGIEEYLNYFLQKPGNVLLEDGNILLIFVYLLLFIIATVSLFFIFKNARKNLNNYSLLLFLLIVGYILFFLYSLIEGKPISGYNESRHYRVAGIFILPFLVEIVSYRIRKKIIFIFIALLFLYGTFSFGSKLNLKKVKDRELGISISEMPCDSSYYLFLNESKKVDLAYVIYPDHGYKLDQCRTFVYQDDFTVLQEIEKRPKIDIGDKSIMYFFPKRFINNGKAKGIISGFTRHGIKSTITNTIYDRYNWYILVSHK
jgi:hypothetical protein